MTSVNAELFHREYDSEPEDECPDDLLLCTWCGGDGVEENPDPLWYNGDYIQCTACGGTGLRKNQTVF